MGSMLGGEDSPAGSVYGYLLTDVMAKKLAQGGGMGFKIIEQQLTPAHAPAAAPAARLLLHEQPWETIVESLRNEIAEYGRLISLSTISRA